MDEIEVDLDERDLARLLSLARIGFGVAAVFAPRRFGRLWTGERTSSVTAKVATRGLGARDIALGMGTLLALEGDGRVSRWLEAQALADASDTASTLFGFRELPPLRRWIALASAGTACWLGITLAAALEDD